MNEIRILMTDAQLNALHDLLSNEIESLESDIERGALDNHEYALAHKQYGLMCQITGQLWAAAAFASMDKVADEVVV